MVRDVNVCRFDVSTSPERQLNRKLHVPKSVNVRERRAWLQPVIFKQLQLRDIAIESPASNMGCPL
eukprot:4091701-Pyramimonas_sp.AAC.1